jgi:hypothetical protein
MRPRPAALEGDDGLGSELVFVTDHGQIGDPYAGASALLEQRVQRAEARKARTPPDHDDRLRRADDQPEIRRQVLVARDLHMNESPGARWT